MPERLSYFNVIPTQGLNPPYFLPHHFKNTLRYLQSDPTFRAYVASMVKACLEDTRTLAVLQNVPGTAPGAMDIPYNFDVLGEDLKGAGRFEVLLDKNLRNFLKGLSSADQEIRVGIENQQDNTCQIVCEVGVGNHCHAAWMASLMALNNQMDADDYSHMQLSITWNNLLDILNSIYDPEDPHTLQSMNNPTNMDYDTKYVERIIALMWSKKKGYLRLDYKDVSVHPSLHGRFGQVVTVPEMVINLPRILEGRDVYNMASALYDLIHYPPEPRLMYLRSGLAAGLEKMI